MIVQMVERTLVYPLLLVWGMLGLVVGWLFLAHNLLKKAAVDATNQGAKRK